MSVDPNFDFGFSLVDETELKAAEYELQQQVEAKSSEVDEAGARYKQKIKDTRDMIMPLLKSLSADSDKHYLFWPNRVARVKEFTKQLNDFVDKAVKD